VPKGMVGREAIMREVMRGSRGAFETWREKERAAKCGKARVLAKELGGKAAAAAAVAVLLPLLAALVEVEEVEEEEEVEEGTSSESKSPAHPASPKNWRAGKSPPSPGRHPPLAATCWTKKDLAPRDTPAAPAFRYSPAAHSKGMQVCGW